MARFVQRGSEIHAAPVSRNKDNDQPATESLGSTSRRHVDDPYDGRAESPLSEDDITLNQDERAPQVGSPYVGRYFLLEHSKLPHGGFRSLHEAFHYFVMWLISYQRLRQLILIVFGTIIAWIPGFCSIAKVKERKSDVPLLTVLNVDLFWWSVYLSVVWAGIWACWLSAVVVPNLLRIVFPPLGGIGEVLHKQLLFLAVARKYLVLFLWCVLQWVAYLAIIWRHYPRNDTVNPSIVNPLKSNDQNTTTLVATPWTGPAAGQTAGQSDGNLTSVLWPSTQSSDWPSDTPFANFGDSAFWHIAIARAQFALLVCSLLVLGEKLFIQNLAYSFHATTYKHRLERSQQATTVLATLYSNLPPDTITAKDDSGAVQTGVKVEPKRPPHEIAAHSSAAERLRPMKGDWTKLRNRMAVESALATGAIHVWLGKTYPSFFNPLSPTRIVEAILESEGATRALALRIFDAFAIEASQEQVKRRVRFHGRLFTQASIAPFFLLKGTARKAFATINRTSSDDCTEAELVASLLELHNERINLLISMHDIDSAVAKLDHILCLMLLFTSGIIMAAVLSQRFSSLLVSASTIVLGLSWMVSSTAQEALMATIFVLSKHPLDCGDSCIIPGLLSSTMRDDALAAVQGYVDGDIFVVESLNLMTTQLRSMATGKTLTVGNAVLAEKPIVNLRRSGPISEPVTISVDYDTPMEELEALREDMSAWLASQRSDFLPGINFNIGTLDLQSSITLTLDIRYRTNCQDFGLRIRSRNRWMSALKHLMAKNGITGPNKSAEGKPAPRAFALAESEGGDRGYDVPVYDLAESLATCVHLKHDNSDEECTDSDTADEGDEKRARHDKLKARLRKAMARRARSIPKVGSEGKADERQKGTDVERNGETLQGVYTPTEEQEHFAWRPSPRRGPLSPKSRLAEASLRSPR